MNPSSLTIVLVGHGPEADRIAVLLRESTLDATRVTTYADASQLFIRAVDAMEPLVCVRVAPELPVPPLVNEVRTLEVEVEHLEGEERVREQVSLGNSLTCPQIRFLLLTGRPGVRFHDLRELLRTNIAEVLPIDIETDALVAAVRRSISCLPKSPDRLWGAGIKHNLANIQMALPGELDIGRPGPALEFVRTLSELKLLTEQIDGFLLPR